MKKFLLAIMFTMALNVGWTQDTIQVSGRQYTTVDTTKLTVREVYTDAKEGIAGLAKALKAPAEHVYTILVRQQIIDAITWMLVLALAIFMVLNFFKALKSTEKWTTTDDPTMLGIVRVLQLVIGVIGFGLGIGNIDVILTGFINPEYGAIKDIFQFVRGGH